MPEFLKKISLDPGISQKVAATTVHNKSGSKFKFPWKLIALPFVALFICIAVLGVLLLPMRTVITASGDVVAAGRELLVSVKNQDLDKTKEGLVSTRAKLTLLEREYKKMSALKAVPLLGSYIADGEHGINAAVAGLNAGDKAIEALEPNADLLGLKGKSKFVSGTADERLQTAVKTMSALTPKVNEMAVHIETLCREVAAIDPNSYPKNFRSTPVRDTIVHGKEVIENAANLFVNAQPLLVNLPKLLGDKDEKRYLVLFQNDKELRSTGGFITAYAQFRLVKGKAILEKADDIYALDAARKKNFPAPR